MVLPVKDRKKITILVTAPPTNRTTTKTSRNYETRSYTDYHKVSEVTQTKLALLSTSYKTQKLHK